MKMRPILFLLSAIALAGCASIPKPVVDLSSKQLEMQRVYLQALNSYFDSMDQYLENYRKMVYRDFDQSYNADLKDVKDELTEKYGQSKVTEKDTKVIIESTVNKISDAYNNRENKKRQLDEQIQAIKNKNNLLKNSMSKVIAIQSNLNDYIAARKYVEDTVRQLITQSDDVTKSMQEIYNKLQKENK